MVLLPAYNDQAGLERSLASLDRDGASFDVVVVDDGSTPPLVAPAGLSFAVTLLRHSPNRGITGALNAGLEHIVWSGQYTYVARLDAGDLSLPGRIGAQRAFLDGHPEHAIVGSAVDHVDPEGHFLFGFAAPRDHPEVVRYLRYRAALIHPAVMIRLRTLEELGFYSEEYPGAEDYELFLRLARRYKLANLETTYLIRELSPTAITARRRRGLRARLKALVHHFEPGSPHAWLGVLSNLGFLLLPREFVVWLRTSFRHRAREG